MSIPLHRCPVHSPHSAAGGASRRRQRGIACAQGVPRHQCSLAQPTQGHPHRHRCLLHGWRTQARARHVHVLDSGVLIRDPRVSSCCRGCGAVGVCVQEPQAFLQVHPAQSRHRAPGAPPLSKLSLHNNGDAVQESETWARAYAHPEPDLEALHVQLDQLRQGGCALSTQSQEYLGAHPPLKPLFDD